MWSSLSPKFLSMLVCVFKFKGYQIGKYCKEPKLGDILPNKCGGAEESEESKHTPMFPG